MVRLTPRISSRCSKPRARRKNCNIDGDENCEPGRNQHGHSPIAEIDERTVSGTEGEPRARIPGNASPDAGDQNAKPAKPLQSSLRLELQV